MRVRATKKGFGGTPHARRTPGEVFDVPATRKEKVFSDPDLRGYQKVVGEQTVANTASWYVEVDPKTPTGRPARGAALAPEYKRVAGDFVQVQKPAEPATPATPAGVSLAD